MKKVSYLLLIAVIYVIPVIGQDIEVEKIYEISGKAKRGNLGNAEFDAKTGNYILTYVTKSNVKSAKFENYRFDKDFNFIKMDQQEFEFDVAKVKFPWWKFRGEEYKSEGITAVANLTGQLVLRKYEITYNYNWFFASYTPKYKMLDKVKMRSEEGDKYYYLKGFDNINNGNLLVLVGLKNENDKASVFKDLHILQINNNLDVVKNININFDYPQLLVLSKSILDENDNIIEILFLFAPVKFGKNPDPQKNRYTFLRVNPDLEILDKIIINSPANYWEVNDIVKIPDNEEYYLYGPSAAGEDKYYDQLVNTTTYKAFQVAKISNHKIDYMTETFIYEFDSKLKFPPDQRQSPAYDGKKFDLSNMEILSNGDLFITGQTWGGKFNAITGNRDFTYKDFLGFHFDKNGKLVSQYGIDAKENSGKYMAPQVQVESDNGKYLYWLIQEVKGEKGEGIGFQILGIPQFSTLLKKRLLTYPRMGKIDLSSGSVSDFILYGKEKYFCDNNFPILKNSSEKKLVLFGSNREGDVIWFVRVRMD